MSVSPRRPRSRGLLSRASLMVAAALIGVGISNPPQAQAANLYWDANGTASGAGGTGDWNTTSAFWSTSSEGADAIAIDSFTSADIAYFTSSAGTVTLGGPITIGGLVFDGADFTITGSTLTLAVTSGSPTVSVSTGNIAIVSSVVAGTSGLAKTRAGILDLQAAGTLSGALIIDGGTLRLSASGTLASTSSVTIANRGTFTLDNTSSANTDRTAGAITSSGGMINFIGNASSTTETLGALTLNAGALTISSTAGAGASALTIPTLTRSVVGGTLYVSNNTGASVVLATAPALVNSILKFAVVTNGAALTSFANYTTSAGSNQTLIPLAVASHTAAEASWTGATVNARPTADATMTANRTAYTLTLDSGIDLLAPAADRSLTLSGGILQTGGTSLVAATSTLENIFAFGANEALFHVLGTLQLDRGNTNTLTGTAGLTKSGAGTLILNGVSTLTVATAGSAVNINEGILELRSGSALLPASSTTVQNLNGATLRLSNNSATTFNGNITVNADSVIQVDRVTAAATSTTHTVGALSIGGGRVLTVNSNDITSGTAYGLTAGALTLTSGGATFNVVDNGGSSFGTMTVGTISGAFTITKTGGGDFVTNSTVSGYTAGVDIQAGRLGWSGASGTIAENQVFSGAGSLVKSGASIVNLGGTNTFTGGITVAAGTLGFSTVSNNAGSASNLGQGTDGIDLNGGTLNFIGATSQSTNRGITLRATSTLGINGTAGAVMTYTGGLTGAGTSNDLTVNGTGTLTISGATFVIPDDITVSGSGLVVNLNSAGILSFGASSDATLQIQAGATLNLGADNAVDTTSGVFDRLLIGQGGVASTNTFAMGVFNQTTDRLDIGVQTAGLIGNVTGSGTLTVISAINLGRGSVAAKLAGAGAIVKSGTGDVTLSGDNSGLTGATAARVDAGNLILDYTTQNNDKLNALSGLDFRGGTLTISGNDAATSQAVASTTLASGGANKVVVNAGAGGAVLNLNAFTRSALSNDGTMRFELPAGTQSASNGITTDTTNAVGSGVNAIIGGWATVSDGVGVFFAKNATDAADGNIMAATTTTQDSLGSWGTGINVTDSSGYTGTLDSFFSLNSLRFNANAASAVSISSGSGLNVISGGILMTSAAATGVHAISGGTLTSATGELTFIQDSAVGLTVSSIITGANGVTKAGAGALTLSGNNNYTGITDIQAGTLIAAGTGIGDSSAVTLADDQSSTLQITGNETIGTLTGGNATSGIIVGVVDIGSDSSLTVQNGTTFAGTFTGSGNIIKKNTLGTANMNVSGVSGTGFTGTVTVDGGLFQLSGNGNLGNASAITVNKGGTLLIDNNGSTRGSGAKILDTTPITLNSADGSWNGETIARGLGIRTDQNAQTSETIGNLNFNSGANYMAGTASGSTGIASIIANNFVRANNATVNARATAMGATTGDRNQFRIGTAGNQTTFIGTLVGGSGAAASQNISIVPWGIGETLVAGIADTNMGNSFITYVSDAGFRALDFTTEYDTIALAAATDNARASLSGANLSGLSGTTVNALVLHNADTAGNTTRLVTGTGAGQTLVVTSGALLFTRATAAAGNYGITLGGFDGGITTAGANPEYVIQVVNPSSASSTITLTATISSPLASTADITKSGRGILILSGTNAAGGSTKKTTLNEGTLEIGDLDNIGGGTGGLVFAGGTLRLGAAFDVATDDLSTRTTTFLIAGATIDTNGKNPTLANSLGNSGAGGLTKNGAGTLTLTGANTFTGASTINAGRLQLDGGDNRLASAAGVTLTGTASLQLGGAAKADQTVTELTGAAGSSIVGGNATVSTLLVNQNTTTSYLGLIGGAGANENRIAVTKAGNGTLTLGAVASTFTGGLNVRAGTVISGNNANTFGGNSNVITLGDTSGSAEASILFFNTLNFQNPITVASGSSGAATIILGSSTGGPTLSGGITLNKDLILSKLGTTGSSQVTGGITGTGNLTISNNATTGTISLATGAVNQAGFIANRGLATGLTTISADIGSSVTSVIQNSATSNLTLSGANIAFTGGITVNAGTLNIIGGATTAPAPNALTVAGGASLNLANAAGRRFNLGSGAINLGAGSGSATLNLELGAIDGTLYDSFITTGAATTAGTVQFNITNVGMVAGTYKLLQAASGLNGATYAFVSLPAGFSYTSAATATSVDLTASALPSVFWQDSQGDGKWNTQTSLVDGQSNWSTNLSGTTNAGGIPGAGTEVIFSSQAVTVDSPTTATTLETPITIDRLVVNSETKSGAITAITIAPGTAGTLTLAPGSPSDGINVQTGAPASVSISAPVILGSAQTWTVADSGSTITVSGVVSGGRANSSQASPGTNNSLTITGSGTVTLSSTANTFTGDILVDGGRYNVDSLNDWGGTTVASSTSKTITLTNGGVLNVTSGTLNPTNSSLTNYYLTQIGSGGGTINISSGAILQLDDAGQLFGIGALTKSGAGVLLLRNQTTGFTGTMDITAGTLRMFGATGGFGSNAAGTSIQSGAALDLNDQDVTDGDALTIFGTGLTASPAGAITNSAAGAASFNGAIILGANSTIGAAAAGAITLSGGITGAFDLTVNNLAAGATTLATTSVNNAGTITNASSGTGNLTISAVIGSNVTGVVHDSVTSKTILNNGTNAFAGVTIKAGVLQGSQGTAGQLTSLGLGSVQIGDTGGSANATLELNGTQPAFANPIVLGTTTGILTVLSANSGTAISHSGGVTGANSIVFNTGTGAAVMNITTGVINNAGTVTNATVTGTGGLNISSAIGSNVTGIIQNSATASMTLSNVSLAFNGPLTVSAGTLNFTGGATTGPNVTALTVAAGGTLHLNNTVGQHFDLGSGALSLGVGTGVATLTLELGSLTNYDRFTTTAAATSGNSLVFDLRGLSGFQAGDYDLITAGSGLSGATYSIGSTSGALGGFSLAITRTDSLVRLSATANSGTYYWKGGVNSSWASFNGADSNFTNDLAGTVNAAGVPGTANSVIFSASTLSGAALATTLDGAMSVKDLTFNNQLGSGPLASIGVAAGTAGTLTITPSIGTAGINVQAGAPAAVTISAPVTLGASQTWTVADAATILASSGGIGGTADLTKAGAGILSLSGTNNYAGITTISAGVLRAGATNGFNQTSAHTVSSGAVLRLNAFSAAIGSLAGAGTVENGGASNVVLTAGADNSSTTFSGTLQNGATSTLALTKLGNGTLTLSGSNSSTGNVIVNGGRLSVAGANIMASGTSGATFTMGSAASTRGILLIGAGASITTVDMDFGSNSTAAAGAAYQTGGTVALTAADATGVFSLGNANTGYGYYELSGGTLSLSRLTLSNQGSAGSGIFRQTGGVVNITTWTTVGHGSGTVLLDLAGGVYNSGTNFAMGVNDVGSTSVVNVRGSADFIAVTGSTILLNRGDNAARDNMTNVLNLLTGGTIRTASGGITNGTTSGATNNFVHVNLNGGTIVTNQATANLINFNNTNNTLTANSGAFVYAGGLTVDTNGLNSTIPSPLRAPADLGVQSIAVSTEGTGYIGAPLVRITGGTGSGATAMANMVDDGSGNGTFKVGSLTITNPGTGYLVTDTLTVSFVDNASVYATQATLGAVTLNAGNVSGGLTKVGAGTLTLSGANTYLGGTNVNNGTLALGANNVLADAGNVTIAAGGTLDVATFNDAVATVSLRGGVITGSTGVLTSTAAYDLRNGSVSAILGGAVGLSKSTADTVTLSRANTYSGVTSVTGGTLAFSAANQLGDASATNTLTLDGGTLSFTVAAEVSLNANQAITIGAAGGIINVADSFGTLTLPGGISSADASANFTKTGIGTLSVTGATNLGGGDINVSAGGLLMSGSVNLNGGDVNVSGGLLRAGFATNGVGAITLAADATLNLYDGATTAMAITGLTLAEGSSLGFDLNAPGTNDRISLTGSASVASSVALNFNNLGGLGVGGYDLLTVSEGTLDATDFVLGIAPSGLNYTFEAINAGQTLRLTASILNLVYWKGDVDGSWNANNAADTNWANALDGLVDLGALPANTDTLVFSSTAGVGPALATTLDGDFTADSLKFTANPTGVTSVAVNQGTGGTLTISPVSANNGISVVADAGAVTIGAPIATGATQTWEVVGGGANGSSLAVTGAVAIGHQISKTGAGVLTLGGSNTGSGGINFTAGTLVIGNDNALGTGTFSIGAGTTLDTGAAAIVNAGNNAQNWNGNFTFTGTNTLNLGTGAVTLGDNVTLSAGNNLTVGGAIGDGAATFGFTKSGAGVLTLNGANTYGGLTQITNGALNLSGDNSGAAGGVTMAAGTTLNLGHANALGSGTLTLNGGILNNISGSSLTLGGNVAQVWNAAFTFLGTNDLAMGAGAVTLGANASVNVTASNLTVNGVIDDGLNTFNLVKQGAGTLTLGAANTYGGDTTLNEGALIFTADQDLSGSANLLTLGASAGSTATFSLDLSAASARFGGAMLVQTDNATPNTITIGTGKTLQVDGAFTIGYSSLGNSTTKLTLEGAGTFKIGAEGDPTNLPFQLGNGTVTNVSNAATLDMSGLGSFYANLGTSVLRIGSQTNGGTTAVQAGSTLILAQTSTIIATTITTESPDSTVFQAIKLGSLANVFNASTVSIGSTSNGRSSGSLDFNTNTGTFKIRGLDGVARAAMNVQNASSGTGVSLLATVDLRGHDADLLLSTLTVGGRSAGTTAAGTGTFSFDTGTLDATTLSIAARTGTTLTSGRVTGTVNLGGGVSTIETVRISTNSSSASTSGDAVAALNISGGTHGINTLTMGVNTVSGATGNGSNTEATLTITGGVTTVSTTFAMGAQNSAANAATTVNSALSTLNISAGSLVLDGSTNLVMGATTLDANNAATASINITGTGSLTVGGNIQYTNGVGTETNTVNLDGGTLDLTGGNIGATGALVTFNAQSGTLKNLAELNGGGALTKTTAGTLLLDTANSHTGATAVSAGVLSVSHGSALGTTAGGTTVTAGAVGVSTLRLLGGITVTGESLNLTVAADAAGNAALLNASGDNTWTGNLTLDTGSHVTHRARFTSDSGILTVSGNITINGGAGNTRGFVFGGAGDGVISGQITGSLPIFKDAAGTWTLSGDSSSSFSGVATVGRGVLQIASEANLGSVPADFVAAQLTLGSAPNQGILRTTATTSLSANRGVTIAAGGGAFDVSTATTLTVSSVIAGSGSLDKLSAGTLSLTGANTYTGTTAVSGGTLSAGAGALAGTSAISVTGATLSAVNYNSVATLTLDATATASISGADLNITGAVTNAGSTDDALNFTAATGKITLTSLAGAGKTRFGSDADITGGVSAGTATVIGALGAHITGGTVGAGSLTGNVSGGSVTVTNLLTGAVSSGIVSAGALTGDVSGGSVTVTNLLTGNVTAGTVSAGSMTGDVSSSVTVTGLLTGAITAGTNALGSLTSSSVTGGTNTITGAATVTTVNGGTTTVGGVADITTLTSGTLNLNGATAAIGALNGGTVNLGTTILTLSSGTYAGVISGATGSLIKTTGGTLTLTGANTFTGATTINAGTLTASAGSLAGTSGITVNGATLTAADYNLSATLALDASATATISGAGLNITGAVTNAGTTADALNFSAATGKITLTSLAGAGKTRFGSDADITGGVSAGTVTVVGSLGADVTGGTVSAGSLSGNVSGGSVTVTNLLTGVVSSGTVSAGSLAGDVSGGSVTVTNLLTGAVSSGTISAGALTGDVSGGTVTVTNLLTGNVTAGTVSAGSMTGDVSSSVTIAGLLTGAITAGTNALGSLSSSSVTGGTNTITGAATVTTVDGGTTTVGGVADITTLTSGTLNLNGATAAIGALNGGTVNLGTTILTLSSGTYAGVISGTTGSLIKATGGTLTLSGANTFGGGTTISAGTLVLGDNLALGSGAVTVADGAILNLNSRSVANAITVVTGGSVIGGLSAAAVVSTTDSQVVTAVLSGSDGLTKTAGELTLSTPNFYEGVTAVSGTAVIKAAFLADDSSSLGASALDQPANLVLGGGATLEFTGTTATTTSRSFTIDGAATLAVGAGAGTLNFTSAALIALDPDAATPSLSLVANNGGENRFAASLSQADIDAGRTLASLVVDGTGTWVLGGSANRFKGDVRVEVAGGTLAFETGALPTTAVVEVTEGSRLRWEAGNSSPINLSIDAGVSAKLDLGANTVVFTAAPAVSGVGAATLEKEGSGTLKIASGVAATSVNVAVTDGALVVNGSLGQITLGNGATLAGSGTMGAVTAAAGSTIAPGNSPGVMTAASMTIAGNTTFLWEVQDAQAGPGVGGYDKMVISGSLDLTGASAINKITLKINSLTADGVTIGDAINFGAPNGVSSIRTFEFASVQTGSSGVLLGSGLNISDVFQFDLSQFTYTGGGTSNAALWSIDWNQGTGAITLTAVPEPSTYGFGLGALALAAAAIRRRKRQAKA